MAHRIALIPSDGTGPEITDDAGMGPIREQAGLPLRIMTKQSYRVLCRNAQ